MQAQGVTPLEVTADHVGLAIANGQKPTLRLAGGLTF
jgi:hypothetical protein